MTGHDKTKLTADQKTRIRKDRKSMTLAELKAKYGGSIAALSRLCKGVK